MRLSVRTFALLALTITAWAASATTAMASTAGLVTDGGSTELRVTGSPGEANDISVAVDPDDASRFVVGDGAGAALAAGPGCRPAATDAGTVVHCPVAGVKRVSISGGDGDDVLASSVPARISGGPGEDTLLGSPGADRLRGGRDGDHLRGGGGADRLEGESGDDRLEGDDATAPAGPSGADRLLGGSGRDDLDAGPGADRVEGGSGDDILSGNDDGAHDRLDCGPSRGDLAMHPDREGGRFTDRLRGCELVYAAAGTFSCDQSGRRCRLITAPTPESAARSAAAAAARLFAS